MYYEGQFKDLKGNKNVGVDDEENAVNDASLRGMRRLYMRRSNTLHCPELELDTKQGFNLQSFMESSTVSFTLSECTTPYPALLSGAVAHRHIRKKCSLLCCLRSGAFHVMPGRKIRSKDNPSPSVSYHADAS